MNAKAPSASEIRRRFVEFFEQRGHSHVPSSSLVPNNDPTLLFVNAGMNQFKDVFTGREERPYSRAVTVQRVLRAGGKHNDLDNVGFTPRHQTLFEMLGNFSFGDYFKAEAIEWGWEFLTQTLGVPEQRLVATIYNGEGEPAPADQEAFELWKRYLPEDRIYRCSAKDNFWAMGDTGPCGPCSEIHLFAGDVAPPLAKAPGKGPAFEDDLYLELWNLVFMQYEKHEGGAMNELPKPSIDTGAGLERVAAAVAGQPSNYETNLLAPLVDEGKRLSGGQMGKGEAPYRVMADHARATAFLIADGVFPDKDGRSYVLRRIMRRAIRHGTDVGLDRPFFHELCAKVIDLFRDVYPILSERASTIEDVVRTEEESFRRTLDRGLKRLRDAMDEPSSPKAFSPEVAADLYDTYGFPLDLTAVIVAEHGRTLDEAEAKKALERRQGGAGGRGAKLGQGAAVADVYFELSGRVGGTEFVGYEAIQAQAKVAALVVDGASVDAAQAGAVEVVLDRTPMYAESGGQVGDAGVISASGVTLTVDDCIKPVGSMHVHRGRLEGGKLSVGDAVEVSVDSERRDAIRRNHSATHLLHLALRSELGDHVVQKGSLVAPDRLRFDYSHKKPLSEEQRKRIEAHVNRLALGNAATVTRAMTVDDAKSEGAIGLFEAKYGETVRVVRIGHDSLELCGGTHVERSADIGLFSIVSETGIAQGVRRVEAVTGMNAVRYLQGLQTVAYTAMGQLHAPAPDEVPGRIDKLQAVLKSKDREIEALQRKLATGGGADTGSEVVEVSGVKLLTRRVGVGDAKALRSAADALRDRLGTGVVVLGAETDGKATLLVAVTKDLKSKVHAGKLVGALATHVDGRGGGRPDLAQAGGPKVAGLDSALGSASAALAEQLRAS